MEAITEIIPTQEEKVNALNLLKEKQEKTLNVDMMLK